MKKIQSLTLFVFTLSLLIGQTPCMAHDLKNRADGHAPIGVMGDHTHKEGETMLSYRYMFMDMDGSRDGTSRLSTAQVLEQFPVAPTDMDMEMHMLGLMYAPRDWVTLMFGMPIMNISMNHVTRMGNRFRTSSNGIGDIKATALWSVYGTEELEGDNLSGHFFHLNTGVSLPTGEIDERDDTPVMEQAQLPYPMQLGSGTFDLMPGVTYRGYYDHLSWGAQFSGTVRLGDNDNDYSLGDRFETTHWVAYAFEDWISGSLRGVFSSQGTIDGADPLLNPMMVQTADPDAQGGQRYDLGFGANIFVPCGALEDLRVAVEALIPLHQDLNGPQLETDITWITGIQWTF